MKYYLTQENEIMAIGEKGDIDGDQASLVKDEWKLLTNIELETLRNAPKTEEQEKTKKISDARKYLIDTSWYIERLNDPSSGKAVPQEVLDKRAEARLIINELEG